MTRRKPDALDEAIDQTLKALGKEPKTAREADDIVTMMMGRLLSRMLEGEMDNHLGYRWGEKKIGDNERNGHSSKTLRSEKHGEIPVDIPRDRKGRFVPRAVPKHKRRLEDFDEKILAMYARGLSTREIREMLLETYGLEVSAEFISDVTDQVTPEVEKWQSRPLAPVYPVVFFDAIRVKIRSSDGVVIPKAVHIALGIDVNGCKDVLGMWVCETESAKHWLSVFNEMKARGVQDILIAVTDGLKGMTEALEAAFPCVMHQTCIVHLIRNSLKFVASKDYKAVTSALKAIYRAASADAARSALNEFASSELGGKYPHIATMWLNSWEKVIPFFEFSPGVRKLIYTTNSIEGLNRQIRKVIKTRASFPNDKAALKLMFLAIRNITRKWRAASTYWKTALKEMAIQFGDRLVPYLD